MTMLYVNVIPAEGRDYRSAKSALADFYNGKYFYVCHSGHPRDCTNVTKSELSGHVVCICYGGRGMFVKVKVK